MQAVYWDTLWVWHPDKRFPRPVSLNPTSLRRQGRHSPPFFSVTKTQKTSSDLPKGGDSAGICPTTPASDTWARLVSRSIPG